MINALLTHHQRGCQLIPWRGSSWPKLRKKNQEMKNQKIHQCFSHKRNAKSIHGYPRLICLENAKLSNKNVWALYGKGKP